MDAVSVEDVRRVLAVASSARGFEYRRLLRLIVQRAKEVVLSGFKFLVLARSLHGTVLNRFWLRNEQTMWQVRADLARECGVAMIDVIPLQSTQEAKAS